MSLLPSGTVTFLFTDIEGSTKLAQAHPNEMPALLARHHEILRDAIQAQNGYIFQNEGDSLAVAFHSALDALNAASCAQQILQNEAWEPASIKVRMGIHTGAAQLNEPSAPTIYTGYTTLATTARIMSAGHGGQVLISGATRELVRDVLLENAQLIDLGEKRLKDLSRPEHLYQLSVAGLSSIFPPLKTLDSFPNNLPTQLTTFVGRKNEITEVKRELETHRLVTLTGSGGTGKTRLSLQVAAELLEKFDHGVWFIELAPLIDPDLIPQAILSTIGIQEQQGKAPLEVLQAYLLEKQMLIVLDNCEHLVSASAQVVNILLNAAPKLKVMASSREALGVKGEASYPVPSLSLPDIKHLPMIEQLSQYEAVRLFIDRALLVAPHFIVDKNNAPFIAQICYRLDGIPLAIELAAARIKMMSVDLISKRLDDRFRLLTGGARTALPRQQTLRALIDWSYDILSENERLLLQRLSAFAGDWTLEAAEDVCAGQTDILSYDVLDLLTQLINKSLVVVIEHSPSGETRYRMLETIRQYAREKLLEAGGSEVIRDKHLAYFVKLAEQSEHELYRSNQAFWFKKLDEEIDNFRMAIKWALDTNVEAGLRIVSSPWRFWDTRGYLAEIRDWLRQALNGYNAPNTLRARALALCSHCNFQQGNLSETIELAEESLQLARTLSDKQVEAYSLAILGVFTLLQGKVDDGIPYLEESLALNKDLGDKPGQADIFGLLSNDSSDIERAVSYAREGLNLCRELGNLSGVSHNLDTLARLTLWRRDFSSPVPWLEEALSIARHLGDQKGEAYILGDYGLLEYWQGNYEQATVYFKQRIQLSEKIGDRFQSLWGHVHLAYALLGKGDVQQAHALFAKSIRDTQKADLFIALVVAVEGLASLLVTQNKHERAAQLFAWADAMREKIGDHRPPVEQNSVESDLAVIHSQLDNDEYSKLCVEGQALTMDQAIAFALEEA